MLQKHIGLNLCEFVGKVLIGLKWHRTINDKGEKLHFFKNFAFKKLLKNEQANHTLGKNISNIYPIKESHAEY